MNDSKLSPDSIQETNGRPGGSSPPSPRDAHDRMCARPPAVAPHLRPDTICRPSRAHSSRTMTIHWTRKRKLSRVAAIVLRGVEALLLLAAVVAAARYAYWRWNHYVLVERAGWLTDYARVKKVLEQRYPNLDWAVTGARVDLPRLDARTTGRLEASRSREEAERILRDFLAAFHDGHLALTREDDPWAFDGKPADVTLSASAPAAKACELLGYSDSADTDLGLDFRNVAPFVPFEDDNPFTAGIVRVGERRVGLVRIASFDPREFGSVCASEWNRYRKPLATTCESNCESDFGAAVKARLLDLFASRIEEMKTAGVELLAVDVRSNGGGQVSLEAAAAELLAGGPVPRPAIKVMAARLAEVGLDKEEHRLEDALALCATDSKSRHDLEEAYWRVDRSRAEAALPCDRSSVWNDWGLRPACDGLVTYDNLDSRVWAELASRTARMHSSLRTDPLPRRTRWDGPLAVLTNAETGSAAELLAGSLHDYAGAVVIGQRTSGSGGGWMFGRVYWELPQSGFRLYVPDHVSYRRDGSLYQAGVTPDVFVRFEQSEIKVVKAHALVDGLRVVFERVGEPLARRPRPRKSTYVGAGSHE
jgi:hypothetical protein